MKRKIALALGSGGARGFCHIGAIRALEEAGIKPEIICGTSMGALVGAAYASGELSELEDLVTSFTQMSVTRFADINLASGGLIEGHVLARQLRELGFRESFDMLDLPFLAVASDLFGAREIWLQEGDLVTAVRASVAIPGIVSPIFHEGRWLMDGGMTNPVPVSACRALGADIVIAIEPNSRLFADRAYLQPPERKQGGFDIAGLVKAAPKILQPYLHSLRADEKEQSPKAPGYFTVLSASIDLMTDQIRRSRMAGEPPHVMVHANLNHLTILDFHRANDAIKEGYRAMADALDDLKFYL